MRVLGLDIGDRRIGVAISDPVGIIASPLTIVSGEDIPLAVRAIIEIAVSREAGRIVVGLPRSMDGTLGPQAIKVQAFVDELRKQTALPVEVRDERLSTVQARRLMHDSGRRGKKKIFDDAAAAAVILQSYLDEQIVPGDRVS